MTTRLTRAERKDQIRADLLASAYRVFLRRGFHAASLEEIAAEAGWSKGAVFSNFTGKDDLFLAVLEDYNRSTSVEQVVAMRGGGGLAGGLRAAALTMLDAAAHAPAWTTLLVEFWTHASRDPATRARASARHEELLEGYAQLVAELADRDGLDLVVPAKEAARSAASLARGLIVERLLDPSSVSDSRFVELFSTHVLAFTRPR